MRLQEGFGPSAKWPAPIVTKIKITASTTNVVHNAIFQFSNVPEIHVI